MQKNALASLLFSLFLLVFFTLPVSAQGRGITIIPPKFELFGNPGDQISERLRVRNESEEPVALEVLIEDFTSSGESGQVVLEEVSQDSLYSLAQWMEPEARDLLLQPKEERAFAFTVNIPRNAEPGGHYASVLFQAGGTAMPGTTAVAQRVGALVLLRVSGNVTEKASVETFETPLYNQTIPLNFTLRMKNDGNTHVRPKGTVVITDLFNKKIDEVPLNGQNVLPGVTRKMDTEWKKSGLLGYYTATLVATYGQQNLPLTAATKFWVASPTAIILISVGTILALVLLISIVSGRGRLIRALRVIVSGK